MNHKGKETAAKEISKVIEDSLNHVSNCKAFNWKEV